MTKPQRIASLLASATEMLYGLGLGSRVIAVSHECDYPTDATRKPRVTRSNVDPSASSSTIDAQVRQMLSADAALYEIDESQLVELAPDLIVTQAQCDVCAVRYEDVLSMVQRHDAMAGCRVVALNPMSLADIFADIRRLAEATDSAREADTYIAELQARVDAVRTKTAQLAADGRPRVALVDWVEPLMLAGNWMPELVELAGGEHRLTTAGEHSPYASWQELRRYDPEIIVIAPCGLDLARTIEEAQSLPAQLGWKELAAVRQSRVYAADGNAYFNRSGPRIVDTLEILAHLIWPQPIGRPPGIHHPERVYCRLVHDANALVPESC